MASARRLLGASILGLVAAAATGCGQAGSTETDTSAAAGAAAGGDTFSAPAVGAASVPAATVEPAAPPSVEVSPAAAVAPPVAVTPAVTDVAAATDAASPVPAVASESEPRLEAGTETVGDPAGTLIAAVGATDLAAVATGPREPRLLIPEKTFNHVGDALRVSYDDIDLLKVLNMEPVTPNAPDLFPTWLKDLEGQRIRIRGYMRPGELSEDLPFFVLARDTKDCCFGANSKPYDIIPVIMREGVTTNYIHLRPFDVVGVFHIGVELDFANPEKVEFMYRIEDAVLIEK